MKNLKFSITQVSLIILASLSILGCQDMERPVVGDYPVDENPPGGPLKFYVPFDGTTDNPLMNAVDQIRAKFPSDNPLTQIDGISGKAVQGGLDLPKKFVAYPKPNDFTSTTDSFTISLWTKHGAPTQTEFVFSLLSNNWAKASMFMLVEGSEATPIIKFFVDEQPGDKWFEWVGANSIPGFFDGQWHHIVFKYDSATSGMTLYKDGVAYSTQVWAGHGPINLNDSLITGLRIGGSGNPDEGWMNSWSGGIDQFRMYNIALTDAQIQDLYNNNL